MGDFKLDILGLDTNTKEVIAVENQLEPSDHTHLGQLLTYASGVEAGIVIWITPELRLEHQQALDWLNENSETSFFGVEVRAISIGGSKPAIDFRVKVAPNDWQRGVRTLARSRDVSPRNELYRQFFVDVIEQYWAQQSGRRMPKSQPQSWFAFGAGKSGMGFAWAFKQKKKFSCEVYIDVGDAEVNLSYLNQLKAVSQTLPAGLEDLEWEELPHARACRIALYTDGDIEEVSKSNAAREKLIAWAVEKMSIMEKHYREPISRLAL